MVHSVLDDEVRPEVKAEVMAKVMAEVWTGQCGLLRVWTKQ